ncbi:MAG: ACT domain-containing protein [bacterium]
MAGISEINQLLRSMSPEIKSEDYVFCTVDGSYSDYMHLSPLAFFKESEGLTLILTAEVADKAHLSYESKFRQITLTVHSSLDAVGLTATVATKLATHGISANVVAAYYHDHIFVQSEKADQALLVLKEFASTEN